VGVRRAVFAARSRKFRSSHSQALLPLVNAPMIDYVLEFLVANNVEEIFIFCSSKASQVRIVSAVWIAAARYGVDRAD
jgi:dTDP-glucose pyrophosphorylase